MGGATILANYCGESDGDDRKRESMDVDDVHPNSIGTGCGQTPRTFPVRLVWLACFVLLALVQAPVWTAMINQNVAYLGLLKFLLKPAPNSAISIDAIRYFDQSSNYRILGIIEMHGGNYPESIKVFSKNLANHPSDDIGRYLLADALFTVGDQVGALDLWAQLGAAAAADRYIWAAKNAATPSQGAIGLELARAAVGRLAPDSSESYLRLADAYEAQSDYAGAIESYRLAAVYEPDPHKLSSVLIYMGRALRSAGLQGAALAAFQRANSLDPNEANTYLQLADQYSFMGLFPEALENFEQARTREPDNARVLVTIGDFYRTQKQYREAESWYRRAVDSDPDLGITQFDLGRLFLQEGRPDEAVVYLERAIQLGWDGYPVWLELGYAYQAAGDSGRSLEAFLHVAFLGNVPPSARVLVWQNVAEISELRGQHEAALEAWSNVLQIDPGNHQAYKALQGRQVE